MIQDHDVVVVTGVRTPFVKAWTVLGRVHPVELGRLVVREAVERADLDPAEVDEVVVGNIAGPADSSNIARVISMMAKLQRQVPAFTVNRNCASGLQSLVEGAYRIRTGDADVVVAAAVESMSSIPFLFGNEAQRIWMRLARSKGPVGQLAAMAAFRPRHFKPLVGLELGLTNPK